MSQMYRPFYSNSGLTIKRDTILLLFVAILIFLWGNGFNLRVFDFSDRFKLLQLIGVFTIFIVGCYRFLSTPTDRFIQCRYFRFIMAMLAAICFPTFIYLVVINELSPIEVFRTGFLYPGFFIFIILLSYRTGSSFVSRLNTLIFGITTAYVLFLIVLAEFPALADILLVKTSNRFDWIRISIAHGLGHFAQYSFCYTLIQVTKKHQTSKAKILYIMIFLSYIWYFFTIAMGKRTIFVIIFIVGYYWFFHLSAKRKIHSAVALLVLIILLPIAIPQSSKIAESVYLSYNSSIQDYRYGEKTVGVRLDGMRYNLNLFHDTGYLGLGLLSNRLPLSDPYRFGREWYRYNPGDHGIVAVFYRFGFPGLILTIIILFHMFKDLALILQRGSAEHQAIAMSIFLYLVFCLVGLLQIIWKGSLSFSTGLMFFMVWRMHKEISNYSPKNFKKNQPMYLTKKEGTNQV